jgi:L-threonylcarbamoyladenylate synthase
MINTEILALHNASDRERAAGLLRAGKLVAIPTETVYGLAANASNEQAIRGVFMAKQRPSDHPLIVHIGDISQLQDWVSEVPAVAKVLIEQCWPGPLTMVFHKAATVSPLITGGRDTVAIRMPDNALLRALLRDCGPVVAPSANLHKKVSPTCAAQVISGLGGRIDAILDGGDCSVGLESTIVDVTSEPLRVLRAGPYFTAQLSEIIGAEVLMPAQHDVAVAGNMPAHYQPNTKALLFSSQELQAKISGLNTHVKPYAVKPAILYYSELHLPSAVHNMKLAADRRAYAKQIYQALTEADSWQCEQIWIEQPPTDWHEVNDRLKRACY